MTASAAAANLPAADPVGAAPASLTTLPPVAPVGATGGPVRPADAGVPATRTPRRIDRAAASLRAVRAAGLTDLVRPATALAGTTATVPAGTAATALVGTAVAAPAGPVAVSAVSRLLPVLPELRPLLPGGGLRRGSTVVAMPSASLAASLVLALLAAASGAGSWCGVVGVPTLSAVAAAEQGIALDRLALVPHPGVEWAAAVAALLDGLDLVVAAPPGPVPAVVADRLAARARARGSVLVPYGPWRGADLTIETVHSRWYGVGAGRGRLRWRELTLRASGRGAAATPREVSVWFPGPAPSAAGVEVLPLRRTG